MIDRPPVVLIHGVGLDHTMWEGLSPLLSPHQVVSYDMVNHGSALHHVGPCDLGLFVDQLGGVVASLGGGPVDVVGFSMGALVAQAFAASHDNLVRRLALLHAVFDRTPAERAAVVDRVNDVRNGGFASSIETALERWFSPSFRSGSPAAIAKVRSVLERNNELAYSYAYEVFATADEQLVSTASAISCPTLVMTGAEDPRSTPAMTAKLASLVANGRSLVLPGLRHMAPVEAPNLVAEHLRAFLGEPDHG